MNLQQVENEPNDTFKLRWGNIYETMELAGGERILKVDQLVEVDGDHVSSKEKQVHIDEMKVMCFFLRSNQMIYSFLLKQLRYRYNVGRD